MYVDPNTRRDLCVDGKAFEKHGDDGSASGSVWIETKKLTASDSAASNFLGDERPETDAKIDGESPKKRGRSDEPAAGEVEFDRIVAKYSKRKYGQDDEAVSRRLSNLIYNNVCEEEDCLQRVLAPTNYNYYTPTEELFAPYPKRELFNAIGHHMGYDLDLHETAPREVLMLNLALHDAWLDPKYRDRVNQDMLRARQVQTVYELDGVDRGLLIDDPTKHSKYEAECNLLCLQRARQNNETEPPSKTIRKTRIKKIRGNSDRCDSRMPCDKWQEEQDWWMDALLPAQEDLSAFRFYDQFPTEALRLMDKDPMR